MKDKDLLNNDPVDAVGLKGNVALIGFEVLEESEQEIVKKIVENYIRKMSNIGNYKEMRLNLQQHKHGKTFKHEINAHAIFEEGRFNAAVTEWNIYSALSNVCDKIISELNHKVNREK